MSGIIATPRHRSHPDCRAPLIQIDAPQTTHVKTTIPAFKQIIKAVTYLMLSPDPSKRPMGFINPEDKGKKTSRAGLKT
jgi:hypothetical protein